MVPSVVAELEILVGLIYETGLKLRRDHGPHHAAWVAGNRIHRRYRNQFALDSVDNVSAIAFQEIHQFVDAGVAVPAVKVSRIPSAGTSNSRLAGGGPKAQRHLQSTEVDHGRSHGRVRVGGKGGPQFHSVDLFQGIFRVAEGKELRLTGADANLHGEQVCRHGEVEKGRQEYNGQGFR